MPWLDLLAYWRSKHVDNIPPSRADIDPISEIPRLVRSLMLVDCLADGFRFRLVGSEVVSRAGVDGTGKLVASAPYPAAVLDGWIACLDLAARTQEPQLTRSRLQGGGSVLILILPLIAADGSTEMLLGGLFPNGASEGFWQPASIERLDIAALSAEPAGAGHLAGQEDDVRSDWTTRY